MFAFDPPENIRKPLAFWCFQGDQKGTFGRNGLSVLDFVSTDFGEFYKFLASTNFRERTIGIFWTLLFWLTFLQNISYFDIVFWNMH